jgi:hypothetical protein
MNDPENVIKGKLAESMVEQLLKASGCRVYSLGSEAMLENIVQLEDEFNKDSSLGKKIASIPDFVVMGNREKPIFVEVKFRTDPESLEEELLLEKESLERFWESKIVLVTTKEKPYFRVLTPPYFSKEKREGWPIPVPNWMPLDKDVDLGCDVKVIREFEKLAEKYYGKQ